MNREIIFRGKRVDNGEWVYGHYCGTVNDGKYGLIGDTKTNGTTGWHVDIDTLSQFTGLTDSKGNKVFEGDIVKCWDDAADDVNWGLDNHHTGRIEYSGTCFSLAVKSRFPKSISNATSRHEIDGDYPNTITYLDRWVNAENIEVLSNRFDNPELTKQS